MDMNFILKAMAEGKTADDLAKEFADALNAAIAEDKRIKEEEAKRQAEEAAKAAKIADARDAINAIILFVKKYYSDKLPSEYTLKLDAEITDEGVAQFIEEIDALIPLIPTIMKLSEFGLDNLVPSGDWVSFTPNIKFVNEDKLAAEPVKEKTVSDTDAIKPTQKTVKRKPVIKKVDLTDKEVDKIIHDFLGSLF